MSSINWMKMTAQRAGSMRVHLGRDERIECNHSNKHINKELSHLNDYIGCNDYQDALQRMHARTKAVDAVQPPQRKVKDRIVACMLEIPCPLEIQTKGQDADYFDTMYKTMQQYFGIENVHGMFVHRDEQHEYTGKDGQEYTSLYHAHVLVSAYTPEKGINGKAFETRKRLHEFNDLCDKTCEREFGIALNTGMLPGKLSVEQLKAEEELHRTVGALNMSREALETNMRDGIVIQQQLETKKTELQSVTHQIERELKKRDRMGKTLTGKRKDRIEVDRETWERVYGYCQNSDAIEQEQIAKQQDLAKQEQELIKQQSILQQQEQLLSEERASLKQLRDNEEYELNRRARKFSEDKDKEIAQLRDEKTKLQEQISMYDKRLDRSIEEFEYKNKTKSVSTKEIYNYATANNCSLSDAIIGLQNEFEREVERNLSRSRGFDR